VTAPSLDYVGAVDANARRLVDAAEQAGLEASVPSCPEWVVADLLAHIGRVHRWAAGNLRRAKPDEYWTAEIEIPEPAARPAWVREGAADLVATLHQCEPDAPAWTFVPPSVAGFWFRRQAHETAMHRVDAELAAGSPTPIDPGLAADGIDELLWILSLHGKVEGAPPDSPWARPITGNGETVHLHCTDVEGEWFVRRAPTGVEFDRVHAKGDAAARGTASDLLTWLSGRTSIDRIEALGSVALLEGFRDAARF
jgi:uncharacterized protein (TIGR03083 family)